jgi:hypothetical protein
MFARNSRYRRLPTASTVDARERWMSSVGSRPLATTEGVLAHMLAEGERLDGLAQQYYEEPRLWWRVCDANPAFLSPLGLIGAEPLVTARFPLTLKPVCTLAERGKQDQPSYEKLLQDLGNQEHPHVSRAIWRAFRHAHLHPPPYGWITVEQAGKRWLITGRRRRPWRIVDSAEGLQVFPAQPPWAELLRGYAAGPGPGHPPFVGLLAMAGIESVTVEETPKSSPTFPSGADGAGVLRYDVERFDLSIVVTYNRNNLEPRAIAEAIGQGGFNAGQPEPVDRIGQSIAIPPEVLD